MRIVHRIADDPEPELVTEVTSEAAEELCRHRLFLRKDNRYHALQDIQRGADELVLSFEAVSRITPPEDDGNTRIILVIPL